MASSSQKLVDFQEPLVIDIGSDRVKFAQPVLNTHHITNILADKTNLKPMNKNNHSKTKTQFSENFYPGINELNEIKEYEYGINQNSIFDTDIFMESFPTLLGKIDKDRNLESFKQFIEQYNTGDFSEILSQPEYDECSKARCSIIKDYYNNNLNAYKNNSLYGFEPSYAGVIDKDQFNVWQNTIERIGEIRLKKSNFLSYYFGETPLIITQKAMPFNQLKSQLKTIYEYAFEVYNTPYLLICSTAMLNLFSHNLTSGIVVDIGDSSTNITAVVDGYTKYESAINSEFMCGRNISMSMAMFDKVDKDKDKQSQSIFDEYNFTEIRLDEYLNTKFVKESSNLKYMPKHANLSSGLYMGNIFSYPEIFKYIFSLSEANTNRINAFSNTGRISRGTELKNDLSDLIKFTNFLNNNENTKFGTLSNSDFNEKYISPYLNMENTLENKILSNETNFADKNKLNCFKQLSLSHLILYEVEKMINSDILNADKYLNIVFTGGIFNSDGLRNFIENELRQLIHNSENFDNKKILKLYFPNKLSDSSYSIAKGMNYLSKMDNLDDLMISISDYYNLGKECLCYNYI